ncbi:hypothetical protein EDB81DRAFT_114385 [Dactylonectria macrodidyma]|uniref:NWD NACHT-NTPase N-terminal domain-containing protein n=1 Tax=Dactylonectria macrodidyma TaxID=307937 RepID=A0A9P9IVY0_9HYPO|nr:hypothetical protein EDB81DRAFT_114385 [Dactylonectria macrodidyma]
MDVAESLSVSSDDLWAAATRTLGDELTSRIDFAQENKQKTLDELLAVTEQARKRLVDKSWSFKRKNGEVVFVRDVLAKAAKWVNHFKDVGDIAVQYDPVHAALPWAGVRFLLNIAVGDLDTYNTLLESTADIAEYICRNALVESLLKGSSSPAADELSRALVKLYAAILGYLARAKSYYNQNTLRRVLKHGVLASSDLESTFTAIGKAQKDVDRCSTNFNLHAQLKMHDELQRMLEHFDAPVNRWDEALNVITDQLDAEKRGKILHWISAEPYRQHHEQTKSEVLEGTGKWLLQDPTFLRWKNESASSILWLRGIPGSGKSKLTSIVVEDAQDAFQRSQIPAPVYFYCSRNPAEPGRSDPSRIAASIARQLSTPQAGGSLLEAAVKTYKQREADAFASGPLRLVESKELILKLLDRYKDATMTIVIDALDECNEATRGSLLDTLEDLLKASSCLLKIFVSSRNDQDIVYQLDNYPNLNLSSNRNSADIDLFVRSETKRLVNNGSLLRFSMRKGELRNKIIHELTSNADGMFRWVSLQLHALQQHRTDEAILERLGRLPRTLAELYQEVLSKIENFEAEADRQLARNALSWMLCSRAQLRSDDFLAAVSVTKDRSTSAISRDQLLHLCCNLVNFDSTIDAFRFSHLSVREFLEEQGMYGPASANALVAEACLLHITGMTPDVAPLTALLEYSCWFWAAHAQAAAEQRQTRLGDILRKFLSEGQDQSSCFHQWHRRVKRLISDRSVRDWETKTKLRGSMAYTPSILLVVCAFDLYGVLSLEQWRQLAEKRPINKAGVTHQEVVVRCGSFDILEWHFNYKIPFQMTEKIVKAAATNEFNGEKVMALLLDKHGADIQITENIIKAAAENRGKGEKVMALLLDKRGVEIQITEDVVKAAAGNTGSGEKVMALLLDKRGAEIQITEDVIKAAAGNGLSGKEVMALLLNERGAEIQITEDIVTTVVRTFDETVVGRFLDKCGTDIQITEDVVMAAARNKGKSVKVMALLLDKGGAEIQIDIVTTVVGTFDETVVGRLLDRCGADIQITEDVVKSAAGNWRSGEKVMALLLDKGGAEIQITEDVVKAAAGNGLSGKGVMALLLNKRGAEIQITEGVVEAAAGNYRSGKEILALLLDKRGAEIKITEGVVKAAAETGACARVVGLLMKTRKSDTIVAITERVCFAAASCGQLDSLHYLCQHIPPTNVDPSWDAIARFYHAAQNGDVDRVNQLLREPIPFDTKNSKGQTPLWIAAFNGRTDVVSILVRRMHIDVNSLSASGQSPIFWPSANGCEDVVNILVSVGAKSHFIDADGRTAVSMARQSGHEKIVRILDPRSAALVGRKLWWRQLSLCIGLILLGLIFSTFCT